MMNVNARRTQDFLIWMLLSIVMVNLVMLIFYNSITYRLYFHSDAAAKNLIAGEIFRTGEFFPKDWNYVNGDLFVIFGHLFILPLLPFFNNGFALHAVSGLASASLITGGTWLLLRELEVSITGRLLFLALLTSGISWYLSENLYGQVSYGSILYLVLFQLFFVIRYLKFYSSGRVGMAYLFLAAHAVIVFLVFLSNPERALASYGLPLMVGLVMIAVKPSTQEGSVLSKKTREGIVLIVATFIVLGLIGTSCHLLLLKNLNNYYGAANARFLSFEGIITQFLGMTRGWLFLLGGLPTEGRAVLSLYGLYEALRLMFALSSFSLPLVLMGCAWRSSSPYLSFMATFALVNFGAVVFFQVFTTVPDMTTSRATESSSRYLTVPLVLMILSLCAWADRVLMHNKAQWGYIFLAVALLPFMGAGYLFLVAPAIHKSAVTGGLTAHIKHSTAFDSLATTLRNNGLSYGYATYWNASVLTVLSKGGVRVRPVVLRSLPQPFRHISSNEWYRANAYKGPTFFLLSEEEDKAINWEAIEAYLGKPEREFTEANWRVIVYPFNVAERLPGWDDQLTEPLKLVMLPNSLRQVGRPVQTAKETWVEAEAGETGYLAYGPYINLGSGKYEAVFEILVGPSEGVLGTVDVAVDGGRVIAAKDVMRERGWQHVALPFEVTRKGHLYEFRVFSRGVVSAKVRSITVHRRDDK